MEARAVTKFARVSPRKMRLVVDQVRGRSVGDALILLKFVPRGCAGIVAKTLRSAVANAQDTQNVNVDLLYIKSAQVGQAGMWKRFMPRGMGRANRIRKRLSHLTVVVDERV